MASEQLKLSGTTKGNSHISSVNVRTESKVNFVISQELLSLSSPNAPDKLFTLFIIVISRETRNTRFKVSVYIFNLDTSSSFETTASERRCEVKYDSNALASDN
jgi:hypothetical protein